MLNTSLTPGQSQIFFEDLPWWTSYVWRTYEVGQLFGYDASGSEGYYDDYFDASFQWIREVSSFGSMGETTFIDRTSTTRTIVQLANNINVSGAFPRADRLVLSLLGTSIPNDDDTFAELHINGTPLLRSDASYIASYSGGTHWTWPTDLIDNDTSPFTVQII
jgi:hypothetical protein